jgi:endonuclease YncB( thermonuclease family)
VYRAAFALVLGLLTALPQAQSPASVGATFSATVVHVADGDTVDVRVTATGERVRIRVHGIDAPERGEAFGQVALRFTRATVFSRAVSVEGRDVDAYGRLVARVRMAGTDLSEALLRAGLACHYRRYSEDPVLERAEAEARAAGRGFWARGVSRPRCAADLRQGTSPEAVPRSLDPRSTPAYDGRVVGNVSSRVYHAPTCRNAGCRRCTRQFATRAEAEAAGFRPAGDCLSRR